MIKRIEETAGKQWKEKEITEGQPKIADQIIEQVKKLLRRKKTILDPIFPKGRLLVTV